MIECMGSILKSSLRHRISPTAKILYVQRQYGQQYFRNIFHISLVCPCQILFIEFEISQTDAPFKWLKWINSNVVVKRVTLMDCQLVNNSSRCEMQTTTSTNSFLHSFMLYACNTSNKMTTISFCLYLILFC